MRTHEEVMATINAIGAPVSLTEVKPDGRFIGLGMNSLMEEFVGVPNEGFKGRDLEDVTGLSDIRRGRTGRVVSYFRRCIKLGSPIVIEEAETKREDGASVWGRHTIFPIFNKFGKICLLMITSIDITELKKTREKLENSLTRVLSGFVKICATCKDIQTDSNQWVQVERYLDNDDHDVKFSHGYCPKCFDLAMANLN